MAVRQKYSIALEETSREYFVVEELPYGLQAQADFGQYILRIAEEKRKKVYSFFFHKSFFCCNKIKKILQPQTKKYSLF